ncbi:cytidine deaminase domain protein [Teladorsagia circumcincta]|uniref:Cytidine deaminase domain protein n=1 Tax=Teladorsagia circumcincta TaxID=45464 RepID=A0A2G9V4E8_TELCI|nr:cytidine deaminase domain protein [Teladorsagia circumcincta]
MTFSATELEEPTSPCGICRQFLIEFGDFKVILGSSHSNKIKNTTTASLLPLAFTPASLDEHAEQVNKT